jgi:hypothetical protein
MKETLTVTAGGQGKGSVHGLMEASTKETGRKITDMELENSKGLMGIFIVESGKMISNRVKEKSKMSMGILLELIG